MGMTEWQPIETAPKEIGRDGKRPCILVYNVWDGVIYHAQWVPNKDGNGPAWVEQGDGRALSRVKDITHWMPLPEPPK